jgi:hypothetical protein
MTSLMNAVVELNKVVSFKCHLTPEYREILAILTAAQRYRSATEAFEASLAHWTQAPAKHWLTSEHAPEKGFLRETRGRQLLALLRSGRSAEGHWLLLRVHEAIRQLAPEAKDVPPPDLPGGPPITKELGDLHPSVNLNLAEPYARILEHMSAREGYRSATEALESYLGMWATMPLKHQPSAEWAAARGTLRFRRGLEFLRKFESGERTKGSWLKFKTFEAIETTLGRNALPVKDVLAILPETVDRALEREFG